MKASIFLLSLAIFHAIPMASAAPITYVDEAADFVITTDNGTAGVLDAGDVVTWQPTAGPDVTGLVFGTTAFTSIQAAVDAADVDGTVRIAAGNYAEGAEIVLNKGLTMEGEGPDLTILSGGGDGDLNTVNPSAHRVMSLGGGAVCTVKNLAIVNGEYQGPPNVEGQRTLGGGGVYVGIFSTVTLENCKVSGNVSNTHGGGLHADNSGSATIKECTFEGNVTNGDGGGLYVAEGFLELLNSTFHNNIASGSGGGGYYSVISSGSIDSYVYCCTFSNNHAGKRGGGFYGDYRWSDAVVSNRILFSTFTGNTAGISQGGLWFSEKGVLGILSGILVVGNDAPNDPNTFYADPSTAFVSLGNLDHIGLDTPDQILEPLADNGGPTLTHYPLAPGSDGTYWTYYYTGLILEDQRGSGRHFGNNSGSESKFDLDWGAVEHKGIRLLSSSPGNGETVDLPPTSIAIHLAARRAGSESGSPPAPELTFGDLSQVVLRRQSNGQSIPVTVTTSLDPATGDTLNITPNATLPVDDYSVEINGLIATHIYYPEETLGPLASPFMTFKISTASDVYVGASGDFTEDGSNVTFQAGTADEVPGLVLGESAFTDIQSAVDKVGTGGTVYIGPGVYDQGDQILVTRSMSLVGSGSAQTILSGGDSHRVFLIRNDADVVIRDMTITEGMVNGTVYYGDGAAIYASGCSLTLDGVVVSESEAARVGGGIFMKNGELSIENSWIDSNRAGYLGFPGFSEAGGVYTENSTVSVSNSTLTGNETSGKGGGIYTRSGTITLSHSTMVGNQANAGGGIYNNGTLTLDSSTIRGNLADMGGGLFVNNGLVTLNNSTLAGNQADTGGGAYLYDGLVTIDPNSLDQDPEFFGYVDNGALTLNHSTISTNLAETGGGVYVESGPLSSTNSIIAGNTATISGPDLVGTITAGSNNLTSGDPMLGPLADNGGPTWTMVPLPGSPAIEGGIDTGSLPATDQRGYPRILGAIVDIGSVEATSLIVSSPADSGLGTLRQIVADAAPGDIITFSDFMDGETILLTSGEITVNKDVTIDTSSLPGGITFDGNDNGRIFAFSSGTYVFDRVTLVNGRASGVSPDNKGGAIYLDNTASLTLTNSTLSGHSADQGGAIYIDNGTLTLKNSTISANEADLGGGIYLNSGALDSMNTIIAGNTATTSDSNLFGTINAGSNNLTSGDPMLGLLSDNGGPTLTMLPLPGSPAIDAGIDTGSLPATDQRGPGFYRISGGIVDIGAVELQKLPIVSSTADSGPGSLRQIIADAHPGETITFSSTLSGQTIVLTSGQITIDKNLAVDASALARGVIVDGNNNGRIFEISTGTTATLRGFTLTNGRAVSLDPFEKAAQGGAIYANTSSNLTLIQMSLWNNEANLGGAIYNSGFMTLYHSTLSLNHATSSGGAIQTNGTLEAYNVTIAANSSLHSGGGIRNYATLLVNNSIVAANNAYNLGTNNITSVAVGGSALPYTDIGSITSGDPMLSPLDDYGGRSHTMPPLAGSPAIDAGDNEIVLDPPNGVSPFLYDQRGPGFNRISGGTVDLGASEFRQGTPLLDWRILHGLDQAGSDDLGNPSGDGIANLLKYAFNMAPNAGDLELGNPSVMAPDGISGLPMIERTEEGRLSFTYVRRKASSSPGVSYQPQTSIDLSTWNPILFASSTVTSIDDEWERVTVVDPVSTDTRFGRVGVTD